MSNNESAMEKAAEMEATNLNQVDTQKIVNTLRKIGYTVEQQTRNGTSTLSIRGEENGLPSLRLTLDNIEAVFPTAGGGVNLQIVSPQKASPSPTTFIFRTGGTVNIKNNAQGWSTELEFFEKT